MKYENFPVALKCLHNSQDFTSEFLREIESHTMILSACVTRCFGITRDPETNNFIMVMQYAKEGSLRQYLNNIFNSIKWVNKLNILRMIANGLNSIHKKGLIHRDFHCDNLEDDLEDDSEVKKQAEEADKINEKFTSTSLPYNEPKNAIDNKDDDNSFGEYSESIEAIDFTKLNLDENN
ncbi:kinase-like domain-containing protein [Rhizophagus irregularis DAOM 181602=DAOM 197198]|nr:kinase-like domain-containing protein [Rhizophagus irregularis DAOM 181602=DAOM 197198]